MSNYTQRQETIDALASMVIEQADRHGFKIEIDAIRDAVEQMAKFAGIEANETEFMLASQKVEDEARLMGKLSEKSGEMENPQERYRLSAMDEGNDHYSVLDTKTQLYWSSEGWQRPDSGWASVLTRSEAARKAYELNRKLSNYRTRQGNLMVSLTEDAHAYNREFFTLEITHMDGDEGIENDADVSGLSVFATQAQIDLYLAAAMAHATARCGQEGRVRNAAVYAAQAGVLAVGTCTTSKVGGDGKIGLRPDRTGGAGRRRPG